MIQQNKYMAHHHLSLNLGKPMNTYSLTDSVLVRRFDNGLVYVNESTNPISISLKDHTVQMQDGVEKQTFNAGTPFNLAAHDAVFFIYYDKLH